MEKSLSSTQISEFIVNWVSRNFDIESCEIKVDIPLGKYGLDSAYWIALMSELEEFLEKPVKLMDAQEHSTISSMAEYLSTL
ncbi:acyl carrier protein [Burkholderia ubonensis]|uniref:acyl carrier protein n=1 Tax=Burkholderia ubonensis TaxID=101571 RepID=UPI000AB86BD3|nr:acyl carrier protein [Burkholderia ubonensis]